MLTKRLIACFDVIGGRVTKAEKFQNSVDVASLSDGVHRDYGVEIIQLGKSYVHGSSRASGDRSAGPPAAE